MREQELLQICILGLEHLRPKQKIFILGLKKKKVLSLTHAQHQYLVGCYDQIITKEFNIEDMGTDKEFAIKRIIRGNREK